MRRRVPYISLLLVLAISGCRSWALPEAPPRSTPTAPIFNPAALAEHIRFLNDARVEGRGTATLGYAAAAQYVSARMDEAGLQPVAGTDFRQLFHTAVHDPYAAALVLAGPDSLRLRPGIDFVADRRSDSGRVYVQRLVLQQDTSLRFPVSAVSALVVPVETVTPATLQWARTVGFKTVWIVGSPDGVQVKDPVPGLLVLRVMPETLARFLNRPVTALAQLFRPGRSVALPTVYPVIARVYTRRLASAGAINLAGYIAGSHPGYAGEAVLVCANLDGPGRFMDVTFADPNRLGAGTAALLEVATQVASYSRYTNLPDRTLIFTVLSGSSLDNAGLHVWLQRPLWPLDHIRAVVYIGLDPRNEPRVRQLLVDAGLRLIAVPLDVDETLGVVPDNALDHSKAWAEAAAEAMRLARSAHTTLVREAVVPTPPLYGAPQPVPNP